MGAGIKQLLRRRLGRAYPVFLAVATRCGLGRQATTSLRKVRRLLADLAPIDPGCALVRVGAVADGGYLLPDDLDGITAVFSPGVGDNSSFELAFAQRGIDAFLLDGTVAGPAHEHPRLHFMQRMLGDRTDATSITLPEWVAGAAPAGNDLVLQMDIEGAEYGALAVCDSTLLRRFRIITVELHHLDRLFVRRRFRLMAPQIRKILATHACVHIHPNNNDPMVTVRGIPVARVAEYTFLRRDRLPTGRARHVSTFPHPLDADNSTLHPHLALPTSMYRTTEPRLTNR